MSSPTEPRNGDYASYIDGLVNQGANAPGLAGKASRRKKRQQASPADVFGPVGTDPASASSGLDPALQQPFGYSSAPDTTAPSAPSRTARPASTHSDSSADSGENTLTLAQAAKKRLISLILSGISLALIVNVFHRFSDALQRGGGIDDFIPVVFMGFVALIFFRASRAARRQSKRPPKPLPTLTTLSSQSRHNKPPR